MPEILRDSRLDSAATNATFYSRPFLIGRRPCFGRLFYSFWVSRVPVSRVGKMAIFVGHSPCLALRFNAVAISHIVSGQIRFLLSLPRRLVIWYAGFSQGRLHRSRSVAPSGPARLLGAAFIHRDCCAMPIAHSPRAPLDILHPRAWAICDRCGFRYVTQRTELAVRLARQLPVQPPHSRVRSLLRHAATQRPQAHHHRTRSRSGSRSPSRLCCDTAAG